MPDRAGIRWQGYGVLWRLSVRDLAALNRTKARERTLFQTDAAGSQGWTSHGGNTVRRALAYRRSAEVGIPRCDSKRCARVEPSGALRAFAATVVGDALARSTGGGLRRVRMSRVIAHVIIRGKVQGVGYRAFVEDEAA